MLVGSARKFWDVLFDSVLFGLHATKRQNIRAINVSLPLRWSQEPDLGYLQKEVSFLRRPWLQSNQKRDHDHHVTATSGKSEKGIRHSACPVEAMMVGRIRQHHVTSVDASGKRKAP